MASGRGHGRAALLFVQIGEEMGALKTLQDSEATALNRRIQQQTSGATVVVYDGQVA